MMCARARTETGFPLATPDPQPCLCAEVPQQEDRPPAHALELLHKLHQREPVVARLAGVLVLVKRGKRRLFAAGERERPVGEHPLRVGPVSHHLADGPLVGGVPEPGPILRHRRECPANRPPLLLEGLQDVTATNERHVMLVVRRVLGCLGLPDGRHGFHSSCSKEPRTRSCFFQRALPGPLQHPASSAAPSPAPRS